MEAMNDALRTAEDVYQQEMVEVMADLGRLAKAGNKAAIEVVVETVQGSVEGGITPEEYVYVREWLTAFHQESGIKIGLAVALQHESRPPACRVN